MADSSWSIKLGSLIDQYHMLKHPFYQAWSKGELKIEQLREYAQNYARHVNAFPTYLSLIHGRCDDLEVRKHLLDNLMDEEAGKPNHLDLWRQFAIGIGVTEEALRDGPVNKATVELISCFREICSSEPLAAGIAVLYCYESQIPSICPTKISGLIEYFGVKDPEVYRYFTVHEEADVIHSAIERELLIKLVPGHEEAVLASSERILKALWKFLSAFITTEECRATA